MTADDILAAARETLDTPFMHQGRVVGRGMDCAGVVCHVAHRMGLPYDAPTNYPRLPYQGLLEATLDAQPVLERVTGAPQAGDVLLLRIARDPQHVAICAGDTIIHAYAEAGKCCEHTYSAEWRRRTVRGYRFRGVA
jgi:cell wall-associated NlpC family hydrolase